MNQRRRFPDALVVGLVAVVVVVVVYFRATRKEPEKKRPGQTTGQSATSRPAEATDGVTGSGEETHGTLLVEQDSDAYNQVVATEIASGKPFVKTSTLGKVKEISLAVRVKHIWLWQEGPGGKHWVSGEEFAGDYVRQALLCQLPPEEATPIVAAMGTVRPQVHLEDKETDYVLEVEGSYNFNTVASSCELRGRFFRRADSLMVGQAVVEFPAPPPPKKGGRIAEGLILRGLLKKASLRLAEEIGGKFDLIPPAEKAEGKTAEPPPPTPPSRSWGWLWGVVGIAIGIAIGPTVRRMASRRQLDGCG